jgi:hypothetical protein
MSAYIAGQLLCIFTHRLSSIAIFMLIAFAIIIIPILLL